MRHLSTGQCIDTRLLKDAVGVSEMNPEYLGLRVYPDRAKAKVKASSLGRTIKIYTITCKLWSEIASDLSLACSLSFGLGIP